MANMEFLSTNQLNTTTMLTISVGAAANPGYLFDRNTRLAWGSTGLTTNTSSILSVQFGTNTVISHILLQNHNLRQFQMFYNSLTANTFNPVVNVTQNSATSSYYSFASITVQSVQIQIDRSINNDTERSIGEWMVGYRQLQFAANPSIENYSPVITSKQVRHEMPDGGVILYNVRRKYRADLQFSFITDAFRNNLFTAFDNAQPLYFLEFPTTTSWDGSAREIVIVGDFDMKYGTNNKTQGWSGSLRVEETPGT